ncbi:membrane integrity-associated transporter subunit PqiC [Ruegeria sp. PrR005]|uniref:Membrane integrity-associated transporter subunit PqiC n=1 Tax=Ruegeria sp. PrR005 TaxID=2706882 RepID=A0A6B2NTC1_9RHOB|nr:PqiC family protein [Ruegeria sp. PrR005]NDW47461.1 membrane integrity-associated transporter subunit PqiC [Ruegeria sp. PrR005]
MRKLFSVALIALAACSAPEERYLLPEITGVDTYRTGVRTVQVARMDLPAYVSDSEITLLGDDGVLRPTKAGFWADEPERAMSEMLAAGLDQALSASVAADPWPFETPADVQVAVKVHRLSGVPGQNLVFSGQYFLTSPAHGNLEKAYRYSYSVAMAEPSIQAMAQAQTEAMRQLVNDIARRIAKG